MRGPGREGTAGVSTERLLVSGREKAENSGLRESKRGRSRIHQSRIHTRGPWVSARGNPAPSVDRINGFSYECEGLDTFNFSGRALRGGGSNVNRPRIQPEFVSHR
jgi:hypothetical protein